MEGAEAGIRGQGVKQNIFGTLARARQGTGPHPSETLLGCVGQGGTLKDSEVPADQQRGHYHCWSGRQWEVIPSSPSCKLPWPTKKAPLPPREGVASSAGCQCPAKPPSSHLVKPVCNSGGVTTSRHHWSEAKPDPTVLTPKRQEEPQSPFSQTPILICGVSGPLGTPMP